MDLKTEKVFVYGSLKTGYSNHGFLRTAKKVDNAETFEPYFMNSLGGFPGVLKSSRRGQVAPVKGEVYEVDQDTMKSLDYLESNGYFYEREVIETSAGKAWMYFLIKEQGDPIEPEDGKLNW